MKPEFCPNCRSKMMIVGQAMRQDGRVIYPYFCGECDLVTTQQANKTELEEHREKWGEPERVYTATERRVMRGEPIVPREKHGKPCEVCGSAENVEVHHWAPAHLFGPESDKWPVGYLCRPCHTKWHRIVTPGMGERKGLYREHYDAAKAKRRGT
ncbi:MAG TPA: hypothetical protein PK823_16510 [Novosphingobium sp.]|nr:hypothetical protein [Novosphingobium sp.]